MEEEKGLDRAKKEIQRQGETACFYSRRGKPCTIQGERKGKKVSADCAQVTSRTEDIHFPQRKRVLLGAGKGRGNSLLYNKERTYQKSPNLI